MGIRRKSHTVGAQGPVRVVPLWGGTGGIMVVSKRPVNGPFEDGAYGSGPPRGRYADR